MPLSYYSDALATNAFIFSPVYLVVHVLTCSASLLHYEWGLCIVGHLVRQQMVWKFQDSGLEWIILVAEC